MLKKLIDDKNIPDEIFNIIYEYLDITQLKCKHTDFGNQFYWWWRKKSKARPYTGWNWRCRDYGGSYGYFNDVFIPYQGDATEIHTDHFESYVARGRSVILQRNIHNTSCNTLKKMLKINNVKGRSKCRTKKEMIQALMKI